jgi:hypothetical protein
VERGGASSQAATLKEDEVVDEVGDCYIKWREVEDRGAASAARRPVLARRKDSDVGPRKRFLREI